MLVKEVMTSGVECVSPDANLQTAARMMRNLEVGVAPVCGNDNRLAGMITDRDITVRAIAEAKDPENTLVRDVMTEGVLYCYDDQDIAEAARLMKDHQVRRLVALNRDKQLVGILSLGDLAVDGDDEQLVGHALEAVSEPAEVSR